MLSLKIGNGRGSIIAESQKGLIQIALLFNDLHAALMQSTPRRPGKSMPNKLNHLAEKTLKHQERQNLVFAA